MGKYLPKQGKVRENNKCCNEINSISLPNNPNFTEPDREKKKTQKHQGKLKIRKYW